MIKPLLLLVLPQGIALLDVTLDAAFDVTNKLRLSSALLSRHIFYGYIFSSHADHGFAEFGYPHQELFLLVT